MPAQLATDGKAAPRPIIVRKGGHDDHGPHHGGAWKIAYADFVTAMMAFFLLLWLVNATTEQQRTGIAEYFKPTNPLSRGSSGAGQPFGGRTLDSQANLTSDATAAVRSARRPPQRFDEEPEDDTQMPGGAAEQVDTETEPDPSRARSGHARSLRQSGTGQLASAARDAAAAQRNDAPGSPPDPASEQRQTAERLVLRAAAQDIRAAIDADPQLRALAEQMLVEEVPEGLRVQMVDGEGQALFATGAAAPNERGRALLLRAASVIARLTHSLEITGHTDAAPFRGAADARSNWELSVERANAARRLMLEAGVAERRVRAVTGRADQDLLRPTQPLHPANRRVSILIVINPAPASSAASNARSQQ
jgi:chemotaxis protein MotB